MAEISRLSLFKKLGSLPYKTIESATVFCKLRGNPYVELVHWLYQIGNLQDSDFHRALKYFDADLSRVSRDILEGIDSLPGGATSVSDFSPHIEDAVEKGWLYSSLMFGNNLVRTGHLLVGILKTRELSRIFVNISKEFEKLDAEHYCENFDKINEGSPEESSPEEAVSISDREDVSPVASEGKTLSKYAVNLTEKARNGGLDPVVGRDSEIRQMVNILLRRRQNNPILTGEAGVGKTAVVEGLALRIAEGNVPDTVSDIDIWGLDVGLLQAGASVKGEFEKRLRQVIDEVQASSKPIVLFIDEAHTLIGAGGSAGTGDAANLLKPALARGTLRTIAATTWSEYKKYIEKDPALTRRFQVVQVDEPDEAKAVNMLRNVASCIEAHHGVHILDEAISASVNLSKRYIPSRQLPDKAVSLLDTACSRVVMSQNASPSQIESCQAELSSLETEMKMLQQEISIGLPREERKLEVEADIEQTKEQLEKLQSEWEKEKQIVDKIVDLRKKLVNWEDTQAGKQELSETGDEQNPERSEIYSQLVSAQEELLDCQSERPLVMPAVDTNAVSDVVSDWTGIPVGNMVKNEVESILNLQGRLQDRVLGQDHALEAISRRMRVSRARVENPNKPIGVMFLVGPSGVGKTETALALAETLYGGEESLITINMSEFQEAHTVSTLKGSPPGYVGYGEGGVLTEAVRRKPYSVVLLDEVEKAHRDVHEIFFQVFDKGYMEDAEGRSIDFRNTLILLTSNVGTDLVMNLCKDPDLMPEPEGLSDSLRKPLLEVFPPALLGRMFVVPYYPISDETLRKIVELQLSRVKNRVEKNHKINFEYSSSVPELVAARCNECDSGARLVESIITDSILPSISEEILKRMINSEEIKSISVDADGNELSYKFG
ncbi:type VI secretion system ATPase TssH [Sedimentisphaera salicampi]|uniref:Chaperone protein ClpB n=1 Tax=Sedimentisphaera salicampi TaxID=1941349 RepID=A0A1W6LM99_9BACT|nr:type VI secretion system ATPase TssH [Sedimentisphaera salicampi]ARN56920.1 Chaperone protein ClpB [Sedimentisphaera salicampi]